MGTARRREHQANTVVYGWEGWRPNLGLRRSQTREIVAAPSKAAAARAAGFDRPAQMFNLSDTGNAREIAVACAAPGVVFYRGLDADDGEWTRA